MSTVFAVYTVFFNLYLFLSRSSIIIMQMHVLFMYINFLRINYRFGLIITNEKKDMKRLLVLQLDVFVFLRFPAGSIYFLLVRNDNPANTCQRMAIVYLSKFKNRLSL